MIITAPQAFLYQYPDAASQTVDEVIYGTEITASDTTDDFYLVKTCYGYTGYLKKQFAGEGVAHNAFVSSAFCDILPEAGYFASPVMTLPRGAKISIKDNGTRFLEVVIGGKTYYAHRNLITKGNHYDLSRDNICRVALSYLGAGYRWGGKTPSGIDCSGLAFMAYGLCGVDIWRDAEPEKQVMFDLVPLDRAQKGDLLFFKGHVAIYLGNGEFVHSSAGRGEVQTGRITDYKEMFDRFITAATLKGGY